MGPKCLETWVSCAWSRGGEGQSREGNPLSAWESQVAPESHTLLAVEYDGTYPWAKHLQQSLSAVHSAARDRKKTSSDGLRQEENFEAHGLGKSGGEPAAGIV